MSFLSILHGQVVFILPYWVLGILLGSAVSVFGKARIHHLLVAMQGRRGGVAGLLLASALGVASPLCMYGTIPLAASFAQKGVREDWLAAFMMCSVLINPQLLVYTAALGQEVLLVRLAACLLCGLGAGLVVRWGFRGHPFFQFGAFSEARSRDTHPNLALRYALNVWRNVRATGPWFLLGVVLASLFLWLVPGEFFGSFFRGAGVWEVLAMTLIGIPFYVCGGGAVPLMSSWLELGMSLGAVIAFTLTGAATKITNMGAVKIVLGVRHFVFFLAYTFLFSLVCGLLINLFF